MTAGFTMLLPARDGARVLELSEDGGARAAALRSAGYEVACARETPAGAQAVRDRGFDAMVVAGDEGLRASDGAFDAVILALATARTRGGERIVRRVMPWVRAAAHRLIPGGALAVILPNPLYGLPVIGDVLGRLSRVPAPYPARGSLLPRGAGPATLRAAMTGAGLARARVFAALPDAVGVEYLVPLESRPAAELFFRSLVPRPRGAPARAAVHLARALAGRGFLELLAPAYAAIAFRESRR